MRIKIVTFHFANNYGAVLQAYALKKHLEQYGEVSFFNYMPKHLAKLYSLSPLVYWRHPRRMLRRAAAFPKRRRQFALFSDFRRWEMDCDAKILSDRIKAEKELNEADAIVYGSDQIWNLNITQNDALYFGNKAPGSIPKVAYGASFGTDYDEKILSDYIENYVKTFQAVSVREKGGAKLLKSRGISGAEVVCDPIFLLDKEKWEALAQEPRETIPRRFLLYYALRREEALIQMTEKMQKDYEIPIYSIHPNGNDWYMIGNHLHRVGPMEFIWLVKHAEFVCTNSYHGTAFSTIFRKKAVVYGEKNGDERLESLIELLGSENIAVTDAKGNRFYDFYYADFRALDVLKTKSVNFLRNNAEKWMCEKRESRQGRLQKQ